MGTLLAGFGRGLAVGLGWGVMARVFMRLVSTEPGFSWAGTIGIVGVACLFWGLVGLVAAARATGRSRWWRVAPLPGLILFAGPGMLLLPGAVVVALALAVPRVALRLGLVALGGAAMYWLLTVLDDESMLAPRWQSLGFLLVSVSVIWLGAGLHAWWRRWPSGPATADGEPATGDAESAPGDAESATDVRESATAAGAAPREAGPAAYGN